MARLLEFTREKGEAIVKFLRGGAFTDTAAAAAGISRSTLNEWLRRGRRGEVPELVRFADDVQQALAEFELDQVKGIAAAGVESWQARAWLLERKFPERYARRGDEAAIDQRVERKFKKLLDEARKTRPKLKAV